MAWGNRELRGKTTRIFNAPFDLRMMTYDGIALFTSVGDADRLEDVGVMAPLYNELEPSFKLGDLCEKYTDMPKVDDSELNQWCADHCGGRPTTKAQVKNYWCAPGDMVEPYAIGDGHSTDALYDFYKPRVTEQGLDDLYRLEMGIIPMLGKMHQAGVRVDVDKARELKADLEARQRVKEAEWCSITGEERFIDSGKRFLRHFEEAGIAHLLEKTDKGNWSFAKEVLEKIDHPLVELIRGQRQLKHYSGTFINNYILNNADDDWLVHGEFHSVRNDRYGTVSGRFSSGGELNLQNIPARDKYWAPLIRGLYIPLPGMVWWSIDYSQIEYRFFAHYCGGRLVQMYIDDPTIDFHQQMADLTGHERKHAKNMNFAALFGAGIGKLAQMLGEDLETAKGILEEYHRRAPEVKDLTSKAQRRAEKRGYITTWGGRRHRFPKRGGGRYGQSHKALNRLCQGSAADLMKYAMRGVDQVIDWETVICHLTVHDELDFSADPGAAGVKMMREVRDVMEQVNKLGGPQKMTVPVRCDAEYGPDWGHADQTLDRVV